MIDTPIHDFRFFNRHDWYIDTRF